MRTAMRRRCWRDDRGAQAVEFAILWTLALVPLLLGLIQFGALMYSQITITQAAREAVRQVALDIQSGAQGTCDSACVTNAQATANNAAAPLALKPWTPMVCPSGATQGTQATVTIQAKALLSILIPNVTVTGTASMPCGG